MLIGRRDIVREPVVNLSTHPR